MFGIKLGLSPALAIFQGGKELWRWTPAQLFIGDKAGHAASYAPAPFAPALMFAPTTAGHAADYEVK